MSSWHGCCSNECILCCLLVFIWLAEPVLAINFSVFFPWVLLLFSFPSVFLVDAIESTTFVFWSLIWPYIEDWSLLTSWLLFTLSKLWLNLVWPLLFGLKPNSLLMVNPISWFNCYSLSWSTMFLPEIFKILDFLPLDDYFKFFKKVGLNAKLMKPSWSISLISLSMLNNWSSSLTLVWLMLFGRDFDLLCW